MSENPYTPPASNLGGGAAEGGGGSGDIDVGQALSEAWANTWSNFPLWLGAGVAFVLLVVVATLTVVGLFLLVPVLAWGFVRLGLRMHDGGAEFGDLFAGFSQYGTALVGMLVSGLLIGLIGMLGQSVQLIGDVADITALYAVGVVVYVVWSFAVMPRFYFASFYLVDQGAPPVEAVQRSWERTGPVLWKLVALMLLSNLILLAGVLALVVGIIPASVVSYLMWVSAYRQLEGGPAPAA